MRIVAGREEHKAKGSLQHEPADEIYEKMIWKDSGFSHQTAEDGAVEVTQRRIEHVDEPRRNKDALFSARSVISQLWGRLTID